MSLLSLPKIIGGIGLAFSIGLVIGNYQATQRALERELDASARRMASNHEYLVGYYGKQMKDLRMAREQNAAADRAAYAILERGRAEAAQSAEQARASLRAALNAKQKLEVTNDGLRNVNEMLATEARANPPDPGCVMPPGVRQSVNDYIARLNASPNIGTPASPATGLPLGPPGANTILACRELAASVIDILQVAGGYIARDASWRAWSAEALK